jgi:hypothetical protein
MRLLAFLAAFVMASLTAAQAQSVTFGGERYSQKYRQNVNAAHSYVELVRDGESLKGWTKLVTLHAFPQADDSKAAVEALVQFARQRDKSIKMGLSTRLGLMADNANGESMFQFFALEDDVFEFNVLKFAPAANGGGVVAVQFAHRFRVNEIEADEASRLMKRAVNEMESFDVGPARAAFAR